MVLKYLSSFNFSILQSWLGHILAQQKWTKTLSLKIPFTWRSVGAFIWHSSLCSGCRFKKVCICDSSCTIFGSVQPFWRLFTARFFDNFFCWLARFFITSQFWTTARIFIKIRLVNQLLDLPSRSTQQWLFSAHWRKDTKWIFVRLPLFQLSDEWIWAFVATNRDPWATSILATKTGPALRRLYLAILMISLERLFSLSLWLASSRSCSYIFNITNGILCAVETTYPLPFCLL